MGDTQGRANWRSEVAVPDVSAEPKGTASRQQGKQEDAAAMRDNARKKTI